MKLESEIDQRLKEYELNKQQLNRVEEIQEDKLIESENKTINSSESKNSKNDEDILQIKTNKLKSEFNCDEIEEPNNSTKKITLSTPQTPHSNKLEKQSIFYVDSPKITRMREKYDIYK
jgi:hypothetical protein